MQSNLDAMSPDYEEGKSPLEMMEHQTAPNNQNCEYLFFRYKPIIPEGRRIPLQLTAKHSAKLSIQLQNRKVCELWGKTGAMYIES